MNRLVVARKHSRPIKSLVSIPMKEAITRIEVQRNINSMKAIWGISLVI
jgi:hypothetical protein